MRADTFKILGVNLLVFLGLLVLFEATAQLIAVLRPAYDVLFLQPDRVVGWKQVPNLRWTWAGHYWYASDFSVDVETNPAGFRDLARDVAKPPGMTRVAVLGDSFIEAVQVPLEKTATQILERRLNTPLDANSERPQRWEVLNFGISNYGVGQYLLAWEQYASQYKPDYVAIFVARFHMQRTVDKYEYGAFNATTQERLWIRPTFRLENGALVREPAQDFDAFVKAQEELTQTEFAGQRSRKKPLHLITLFYAHQFWDELKEFAQRFDKARDGASTAHRNRPDKDKDLLAVNLKIIEELGRKVHDAGGKLIVVDASQYFGDDATIARSLTELCARNAFGYIPLYENLLHANSHGISTSWSHDGHFNDDGNIILAGALYDWINANRETRTQTP